MNDFKIIGVGGLPRSGKDSLAEVFIDNGFYGVSLGDIVRNEARVRHADAPDPISVANMTETSNHLRTEQGADFAMKKAKELFHAASKTTPYKGLIVFSVRAQIEVDFIVDHPGEMIWVETSDAVRYDRYTHHMRDGEAQISKEELLSQEALQWEPQAGEDAKVQMNVKYVKEHSTRVFDNNGSDINDFENRAKQLLKELTT
jgi:dephospho-CoA kinase